MKKEKYMIRQVKIAGEGSAWIEGFSMRIFAGDFYGILCEDLGTREILTQMFGGGGQIQGGAFFLQGTSVEPDIFFERLKMKTAVISPQNRLIQTMTIVENICMFSDVKKWQYKKHFAAKARKLAEEFYPELSIGHPIDRLSEKERVIVELLRACAKKQDILVFSGLSTFLPQKELRQVQEIVERIVAHRPEVSCIVIENPTDMVFSWADRVQVLKGHIDYGCFETSFLPPEKLYDFYADEPLKAGRAVMDREETGTQSAAFSFQHVTSALLQDVSFQVAAGTFLKIFCQDTRSMHGIYRAVSGTDALLYGQIELEGQPVEVDSLKTMRRKKICYCKAKAYDSMLFQEMTARDDILIELSMKIKNPYMQKKYKKSVDHFIEETLGKGRSGVRVSELTIIERQKLAFLKMYMIAPKILFCELPFFDADTRMKEVTMDMLKRLAGRGIAVVLLTIHWDIMEWFSGEELYLSSGKAVDKTEIYRALYPV